MDEDLELLQDFRTESLEHMGEIEPLFLEIEDLEGDEQNEVVNQIFRAAHSVKGAAGFFGLDRIQNLSHTMENLLMRVRDGELAYSGPMTDALLVSVDKLTQLIQALPEIVELSIEAEIAMLTPLIEGEAASAAPAATPEAVEEQEEGSEQHSETTEEVVAAEEPEAGSEDLVELEDFPALRLDPEVCDEAARFGQRIFAVRFFDIKQSEQARVKETRSRLGAIGRIVGGPAEEDPESALVLQVATVLEPDLFEGALGLDEDDIRLVRDRVEMSEERLIEAMSKAPAEAAGSEAAPAPAETPPAAEAAPQVPAPSPPAESDDGGPQGQAGSQRDADSQSVDGPKGGAAAPSKSVRSGKKVEAVETVRVSVDLLDKLMNLAGELVLGRNQLLANFDESEDPAIKAVLQNLDIVTSDMQSNIMNTRMQQVGNVFKKYHRVVRDLSRKLGKHVALEIEGSEVELDKSIIELLSDPLTHLVRNSLDHGMEEPAERLETGKPETGRIKLCAYHEGGQVNIEISDDGKGIDPQKTREAAVERGLMSHDEAVALSDADAVALIFSAGFSLAAQVTEVSGRGVGMDVVRANITKLGGKIEVESAVGVGTTMRIRLPLTLAIVPSLIVAVNEERFAVPQVNLVEIVRVKPEEVARRVERIKGADVGTLASPGSARGCARDSPRLRLSGHRRAEGRTQEPHERPPQSARAGRSGCRRYARRSRAKGFRGPGGRARRGAPRGRTPIRPRRRPHRRQRGDRREAAFGLREGVSVLRGGHDHGRRPGGDDPRRGRDRLRKSSAFPRPRERGRAP